MFCGRRNGYISHFASKFNKHQWCSGSSTAQLGFQKVVGSSPGGAISVTVDFILFYLQRQDGSAQSITVHVYLWKTILA